MSAAATLLNSVSIAHRLHSRGDVKIDGVKFDLSRYPYLIELYDRNVPRTTILKGAQMGFSIEETRDFDEEVECDQSRDHIMRPTPGGNISHATNRMMIYSEKGLYMDENGMYRSRLIEPIVTYKLVTKKPFGMNNNVAI